MVLKYGQLESKTPIEFPSSWMGKAKSEIKIISHPVGEER